MTDYSHLEIPHNKTIQCRIYKIEIINEDTISFYLPKLSCTDMSGAIKLASIILPTVKRIMVYVEEKLDITYYQLNSSWKSERAK